MKRTRTAYRDSTNGRFVSKKTWKQGKKSGSKRYKREKINLPPQKELPPPPGGAAVFEYMVTFTYDKTGRSFDVIVTATTKEQAEQVAKEFLAHDRNAQKITKSKYSGWDLQTAIGKISSEAPGEAEYREDSEEEE